MKEHQHPEILYRYTNREKYRFNRDGYLLPHHKMSYLDKVFYPDNTVPMVSEIDWEFIAKYFASRQLEFIKLSIETKTVEILSWKQHSYLKDKEYFGKVHRNSIVVAEICGWEEKNIVVREIYNTYPGVEE